MVTGGWIIRNHRGIPLSWGSLFLDTATSPLEAETKALLAALQQTWIRGFKNVIFEVDSEILIKIMNGSPGISSISNLLADISFWASKFSCIKFDFVKREGNQVAHVLAKFGCVSSPFYANSVSQPLWLAQQICNDIHKLI